MFEAVAIQPSRRNVLRIVVLALLACLPVALICGAIMRFSVNVPYEDEWTVAPFYVKAQEHTLTWSDLFAQHNEHRYFFPRLMMIFWAFAAHGDVRAEMYFSVFLCLGSTFLIWRLVSRTIGGATSKKLLLLILFNLLLFSPVQAENWLWGFQFNLFFISFLVILAATLVSSSLPLAARFVASAAIAFVASFSFGNGMVLWITTLPVAVICDANLSRKKKWLLFGSWAVIAGAAIFLYLADYIKPAHHPPTAGLSDLGDCAVYVVAFLGAHLCRATREETIAPAVAVGTTLLVLYLALAAFAVMTRDRLMRERVWPWLSIGAFSLASATMASLTRIHFGIVQGMDSRYTTFSLLLSVSVIGASVCALPALRARVQTGVARSLLPRLEGASIALLLFAWMGSAGWGLRSMAELERTRAWGKAALLFAKVTHDDLVYETYLNGWARDVLRYAEMETALGLLHPPLFATPEVDRLPVRRTTATTYGYFDTATMAAASVETKGWAALPHKGRTADGVAVTYRGADGIERVVAVNDQIFDRPDVVKEIHQPTLLRCGWMTHFERSLLPAGPVTLRAWAIDARHGFLYQIGGEQALP